MREVEASRLPLVETRANTAGTHGVSDGNILVLAQIPGSLGDFRREHAGLKDDSLVLPRISWCFHLGARGFHVFRH